MLACSSDACAPPPSYSKVPMACFIITHTLALQMCARVLLAWKFLLLEPGLTLALSAAGQQQQQTLSQVDKPRVLAGRWRACPAVLLRAHALCAATYPAYGIY